MPALEAKQRALEALGLEYDYKYGDKLQAKSEDMQLLLDNLMNQTEAHQFKHDRLHPYIPGATYLQDYELMMNKYME